MKYTVYSPSHGYVIARGLTALQAMGEILSHDGYAWQFRRARDGRLSLWHSDGSAASTRGASHFERTVVSSSKPGIAGQRDIAMQVIRSRWRGLPEAMADADFSAMEAEAVNG